MPLVLTAGDFRTRLPRLAGWSGSRKEHLFCVAEVFQSIDLGPSVLYALPRSGNVTEQRLKLVVATALAEFDNSNASAETRAEVERLIAVCHRGFPRKWHMSMRLCLEHQHGAMQVWTNNRFWESLGGV